MRSRHWPRAFAVPRRKAPSGQTEKIDRLMSGAVMAFLAYGVRVGIRASEPGALEKLVARLPYGFKPSTTPGVERLYSLLAAEPRGIRRYHVLYADATRLARTFDLGEALDAFEADLRQYVAVHARRRVFVHAGVVGWNDRAIVVPGRSFSGKTTLVSALVRAGATYYSDEYGVFDDRGRVHPFLKPLSIRDARGRQTEARSVEALGGAPGTRPLRVACVVVTEYRPRSKWRPRRLSPGRAVLSLLAHTVPARSRPEAALRVLQKVARRATTYKGTRGEADDLVSSLLPLL